MGKTGISRGKAEQRAGTNKMFLCGTGQSRGPALASCVQTRSGSTRLLP